MKVFQYALSRGFNVNSIPTVEETNLVLYSNKVYSSRNIINMLLEEGDEELGGVKNADLDPRLEYWSDYRYDNLKYKLQYDLPSFINTVNSSSNIFDKIIKLNPKQVGIVNLNVEKMFCQGNEIHFSILKYANIPLIFGNLDEFNAGSPEYNRNKNYKNGTIGWGDININNTLFSSLFDSFSYEGKETILAKNTGLDYELTQKFNIEDVNTLTTLPFLNSALFANSPFLFFNSGSKIGSSVILNTNNIYKDYSIKLSRGIEFSEQGAIKGAIDIETGLTNTDKKLRKMYFWKSALVTAIKEDNTVNYYVIVGLKPDEYNLSGKINRLFFIDLGNTFQNNKFDDTDIILYHSELKTFLKKINAKTVYFTDVGDTKYGNICPNGLAFGAQSELLNTVLQSINSGNANYCSVEYEISNIYNIFTSLQE